MTAGTIALLSAALILPSTLAGQNADTAGRADHQIGIGQTISGQLTAADALTADDTYAQAWRITGLAGRVITVDLASADFDAFLLVRGPGIDPSHELQDDDSGGHCNAQLSFTFPASGDYTLIVTTSAAKAVGAFTLVVRAGAAPPSLAPCRRS
jgi:hypothetical protein